MLTSILAHLLKGETRMTTTADVQSQKQFTLNLQSLFDQVVYLFSEESVSEDAKHEYVDGVSPAEYKNVLLELKMAFIQEILPVLYAKFEQQSMSPINELQPKLIKL